VSCPQITKIHSTENSEEPMFSEEVIDLQEYPIQKASKKCPKRPLCRREKQIAKPFRISQFPCKSTVWRAFDKVIGLIHMDGQCPTRCAKLIA
jgi:hypothetical protein